MNARTLDRPYGVSDLRCEGLVTARLIDARSPRFSWRLDSSERGARQSAYRLRMRRITAGDAGETLYTGRIDSDQSQWVEVEGLSLTPKSRYEWQVKVWDGGGRESPWSEAARFETSLLGEDWPADWIGDGAEVAKGEAPPARYFRSRFSLSETPVRATLYLSAFGLAEPWINGERVTEDCFLPGWPDYRKRGFYVSYDVNERLLRGENGFGIVLGDGWYSGTLFLDHQYAPTPMVSAWIEVLYADGRAEVFATGEDWERSGGPIVANGIYFGETYDARLADASWTLPGDGGEGWKPVVVESRPEVELDPRLSPPVRRIEELIAQSRRKTGTDSYLYDLGQNMVGWVRLKVQEKAGRAVTLRFAEMLEEDGSLHTENLRSAQATAGYVAAGAGLEVWEPRFTFFGFRYVELIGVEEPLPDAVTGVVAHTDLDRTGQFECSDPLLNQLYSNALWGQKGNFLELPTDCPQRDERLGWTGDAQVFCHTALYNMGAGAFYRQWLRSVRDSFEGGPEGGFGSVAPYTGFQRGAAGWSDAGAIVPWIAWLHTGDRAFLEENFEAVRDWVALMKASAPEGIRISEEGWGDWLAPWHEPKKAPTPYRLIATAYYAYSTQIAIWMAEELGRDDCVAEYRSLLAEIKTAFQGAYIHEDGSIVSGEQTAYLLALGFDLVSEELRPAMVERLVEALEAKGNHLSTGFIGTPLLAPTLSREGKTDLAYEVVMQESYPGWLFSVKNGATTIWERWDSWTPDGGFNPAGMNSFNHYAYGSVVGWFYDTIAGIRLDPAHPGWKRFAIAPEPGGGLTFAKASLDTGYGRIASHWKIAGDVFELEVEIPANTQAKVSLPGHAIGDVTESGVPLANLPEASERRVSGGRISFDLGAGSYRFAVEQRKVADL